MQPDFGQAALILFAWGVMYFVAGAPMTILIILAGLVIFGGTIAYSNSEHFARRIDGFLSPDLDPTFLRIYLHRQEIICRPTRDIDPFLGNQ